MTTKWLTRIHRIRKQTEPAVRVDGVVHGKLRSWTVIMRRLKMKKRKKKRNLRWNLKRSLSKVNDLYKNVSFEFGAELKLLFLQQNMMKKKSQARDGVENTILIKVTGNQRHLLGHAEVTERTYLTTKSFNQHGLLEVQRNEMIDPVGLIMMTVNKKMMKRSRHRNQHLHEILVHRLVVLLPPSYNR